MKSIVKVGAFLLLLTTFACASSKSHATPEELAALDKMLSNKQFKIEAKWAQPMASQGLNSIANAGLLPPGSTASRIDVSGSSGYLRMVGDSVKANLPFFGERQMGGYYDQDKAGIKFEGIPKNLSFSSNKKDTGKTIRFTISQESENFQVIAQLYPNGKARLAVSSSHRTNIWYQGNLSEYKEE
ncbi:secreted protein [Allomuricauda ruestringensis DSM 13258]|uniref:Secreted protein n=1 Tax=Allomuricauda ruestringensis (strain DSM 13258 / CIP 107369 / LMG 19739 / B1) TaxID=886377 RepID=G2PLB8_ALLRU|nr:DUF4251 domain-containing protein [Allomuricauda ruestringensis]AEM72175.1 secreted protein [Allomuricauda ruestringensis DSM 13258]